MKDGTRVSDACLALLPRQIAEIGAQIIPLGRSKCRALADRLRQVMAYDLAELVRSWHRLRAATRIIDMK